MSLKHALFLLPAAFTFGCAADLAPTNGTGGGAGTGGGTGPGGGGVAPVCEQSQPITVTRPDPPDLLLVMDRSGSMGDPIVEGSGGPSKLNVMRDALKTVVAAKEDTVLFGLAPFPALGGGGCSPGTINADPDVNNAANISGRLDGVNAGGGTPVASTMKQVETYFAMRPVNPAGRYVLLATDGEPTCLNNSGRTSDVDNATAAIKAVADAGVKVYILGFGNGVNGATQQGFATAGGTSTPYSANSPEELRAALDAITGAVQVPPCTMSLQGSVANPDLLRVEFDAQEVPRDPAQQVGWDYDAAGNSITFYGTSCDTLQSGDIQNVAVDYGCGGTIL